MSAIQHGKLRHGSAASLVLAQLCLSLHQVWEAASHPLNRGCHSGSCQQPGRGAQGTCAEPGARLGRWVRRGAGHPIHPLRGHNPQPDCGQVRLHTVSGLHHHGPHALLQRMILNILAGLSALSRSPAGLMLTRHRYMMHFRNMCCGQHSRADAPDSCVYNVMCSQNILATAGCCCFDSQ